MSNQDDRDLCRRYAASIRGLSIAGVAGLATVSAWAVPDTGDAAPPETVRAALGTCEGDEGFDAAADLNGDGCVNALDVALARGPGLGDGGGGGIAGGGGESIELDEPLLVLGQGGTGSVLVLLKENTTPLFGYSLDVNVIPGPDSEGDVFTEVRLTNYFEEQNLIIAGGATMDPVFSLILDPGDGGVFVTANTDDGSTVLAQDGVNDVFAEIVFRACVGTEGEFTIDLGPATALSDADGFAVPYAWAGGTISVVADLDPDFDDNCIVDVSDLVAVIVNWGACPGDPGCAGDANFDGEVDVADLVEVILAWG